MSVKCPKCQTDNPDTQRFCGECATSLQPSKDIGVTKTIETPVGELTRGTLFADRYEIIEELGKGGMGNVYRVEDTKTKEEIALKLIKPEIASDKNTIDRFRNELTTARKIRHLNVCGMYDLGEHEGTHFITLEYVSGQDLKGLIRQTGQLAVGTTINIAKQICDGLSEAHKLGVVHRDLKPSNIMINKEGDVRIMDFGIARSLKAKGITKAGAIIGTPDYISPEQVDGKDVDQRADVYSLGVILYEMVTGRVPFEGDTPLSIAYKHKHEAPQDPRKINAQIPDDLNHLILKCLEKDKDKRYQSAEEVRSELANIEKGIPTTERVIPKKKPLTSKEITLQLSMKKLLLPALFVGALVIAAVMVIWQPWSQKASVLALKIENSIAVISFKNQTGDPAYDYLQEVIPNLLITNLENSGLFYVTTWERMQDILKQMGVKQAEVIDSDLGFELCRREGIQAIAIGTFSRAGEVFIMDVKVLDTETKRTLKSANTKGTGADSIFGNQIDELSREISLGLGAEMGKAETAQLNIKGITTHSLEAYKYFLKGKEACQLQYWEEARENLERALEIDPAFAMVYVYLSWSYIVPGPEKAVEETIEKAMELSDKTSQKDRLYLDGLYAYFVEKNTGKAVKILDELLQKYPDEKWALHMSGDFIRDGGDLEGASAQYEKWIELDPQDVYAIYHLCWISILRRDLKKAEELVKMHEVIAPAESGNLVIQSRLYRWMGQVDMAIAKLKQALEVHPDYIDSMRLLTVYYSYKEDYKEAMRWANDYMSMASSPTEKFNSYIGRGNIHFLIGAFDDAMTDFTLAVQAAKETENLENQAFALERKGFVCLVKGEYEASRESFENMLESLLEYDIETPATDRAVWAFDMGMLALEQGQIGQANARLSEIKSLLPEINKEQVFIYNLLGDLLQGELLLAQGTLDGALAAGKRACGPESPYWKPVGFLNEFQAYYMDLAARIYERKGDVGQAISEYERLLKMNFSTGFAFPISPLYHYRLALLYERANEALQAEAEFEKFLALWNDADSGFVEVEDARKRLVGLKGNFATLIR